jgi:hypothetical protein
MNMADYGKLNFSVALAPTSAFPLDARLVFKTYEEALAAARTAGPVGSTDTIYHYGMMFTVVAADGTTKYYSVTQEKDLVPFGESSGSAESVYRRIILATDEAWTKIGDKWQVRIGQTDHGFKNVTSIKAERATSDAYENMLFSYKRYFTGSVGIITDKKIDIKILIKGEK